MKEREKKQKESPLASDKEKCRKAESLGLGKNKIDENEKSRKAESSDKKGNVRKTESTDLGRDKTDKSENDRKSESSGFRKDESDKQEKARKAKSPDLEREDTHKKEDDKKAESSSLGRGTNDKKEKNRRSESSALGRDKTHKKENDKKAESLDFVQSEPDIKEKDRKAVPSDFRRDETGKKEQNRKAESSNFGKDETDTKDQNRKVESSNFGKDKTGEKEKNRKAESSDVGKEKTDRKEKNRKTESSEFRGDNTDEKEKSVQKEVSGLRKDENKKNGKSEPSDFWGDKPYKTEETETFQDVVTGDSLKSDDATMGKSTTAAVKKKSKPNKSPTQYDVSSNTWKHDDGFSTEKSTTTAGKKKTKQNKKSPTQDVVSTGTLKDDDNISMEKSTTTTGNKKMKETEQSPKQSEQKQDSAIPSSQENSYPRKGKLSPKDDNLMSKEKDTNMNTPKCDEVLSSGSITDTEVKCVEVPLRKGNLKCSESELERNEEKSIPISFASKVTNEAKQIPISFASKVATSNKQTSLIKENNDDKNGELEDKRTNPWKMPWKVSDSGSDIKSKLNENTEQLPTKGFAHCTKDDFQDENDYKFESKQQSKTQSNEKNLNECKTAITKTEPPTAIKFSDVCKSKKKATLERSPPSEPIPSLSDIEAPDISTETDINVSVYLDSESDLNVIAMDTIESELIGASVDISEECVKNKKLAEKKQDTDAESSELSAKGSEATVADNAVNIKEISEMEESMMDMSITVQSSKTSDEVVGQSKDGFQASVSKNKKKKRKNKKYSDNGS